MDFSCFAFVDFVDELVGYQQAQVIPFLPILSISFSCSIALPGAFNFLSLSVTLHLSLSPLTLSFVISATNIQ